MKEIVYQAKVTTEGSFETYIGMTATDFKTRWRNHQMSFKHEKRENDTELSKHLWALRAKNKAFTITWRILAKAKAYSNTTKRCGLCTAEKHLIIMKSHLATLNRRNELVSTCRHRRKYILTIARDRCYADNLKNVFGIYRARSLAHAYYIFEFNVQFISRDHIVDVDFNNVSVYI